MLSGKEIVGVINACKKASVKKFKLESLEIDFEEQETEAVLTPSQSEWIDNLKENLDPIIEKDQAPEITEDDLLPVTDPVAWEESLLTED